MSLAVLLLAPSLALAQQDALSFEATTAVEHGAQTPQITFHPVVSGRLGVRVDCDGKVFTLDTTMTANKAVPMSLTGFPEGVHDCVASVTLRTTDGTTGELGFTVQIASLGQLVLSATIDDYDRERGTLVIHADRDVSRAEATVYGPRGVVLGTVGADLHEPRVPRFSWSAGGQEVVKVVVQASDAAGFRTELELLPWHYAIPHEDIVFATGASDVLGAEAPKLERSWSEVAKALELYGSVVPIKLFIAGYTDTTSDAASNLALSERRARAIASWFRGRGFSGPIYYQGFGEAVLAVPTADGVDEAANRRALYVLAADVPPRSGDLPRGDWKRL